MKVGSFSFNTKGGGCEVCGGAGVEVIGMHFIDDVEIPCEACGGRPSVLEIKRGGLTSQRCLS